MNDAEILNLFNPLWAEVQGDDSFPSKRPLLAHYTSMTVLEEVLRNKEIWFSHPLLMNDPQEVTFGLNAVAQLFDASERIRAACETPRRFAMLRAFFVSWFNNFVQEHLPNTFVLCFSEHAKEDNDGLLSMWRGYGDQGRGVAIVFDTAKIIPRDDAFLIVAKLYYGSEDERRDWIRMFLARSADILESNAIPDDKLYLCAFYIFERLKQLAIFTKHYGFREENEWRIVYMRGRANSELLNHMIGYWNGPRGVEPKLKFRLETIAGMPETDDLSLEKLIDRIILGPVSSLLAVNACATMVQNLGHPDLKDRIRRSTIPFRMA
jgi:Protein of unknown function (DUF2971)